MICQATVGDGKWEAWDIAASWCEQEADTTVPLTLIPNERIANVWLCDEHAREFFDAMDVA